MKPGNWIDKLVESVGEFMSLETTDGILREGRISGFTYRSFILNGDEVQLPIEIEVNGDPSDRIPIDRIAKIDLE
jgi:hypothetical protein